ncbi:MAG: hypothetical protein ACODAJ_10795 [Planctomycetota bacterium]
MNSRSLFQAGLEAAREHKYLASEKAGRDLGLAAIDDWQRRHWTIWLRHRWLEHLLGESCWEEFDPGRFGRLRALFATRTALLDEVVERVRHGAENIDILRWAVVERRDLGPVKRMLCELRLNEIRCTRACFDFAQFRP